MSKAKDRLVSDLLVMFEAARKARVEFDDKCERIDEALEPWASEEPGEFNAPHVHHQIETLSANMIDPDSSLEIRPREFTDEENVKAMQAAANYELERCRWPETLADIVRTGNRYGKAIAKTIWVHEEREFPVPQPRTLLERIMRRPPRIEYETVVTRDGIDISMVDLGDFWLQPGARRLHLAEYVVHRSYVPLGVLKERQEAGIYHDVDSVRGGIPSDDSKRDSFLGDDDGRTARSVSEQMQDDPRSGELVEVLEFWWKAEGRLVVLANRKTVIRDDPWPYRHGEYPFTDYTPMPSNRSFWGVSPAEPLIPVQDQIWRMENQRIDAVQLALNPTLLVRRGIKNGNDFKITMGGRIFVDRADDIVPLRIDVNAAQAWDEIQASLGYMQQISGVSPFIAGADPSQYGINQNTATGVNQLAGAAGKRVGFHIFNLERFIARTGDLVVQLLQQFMDDEQMVRIVGEDGEAWRRVAREQIMFQFDCRVAGSTEEWNRQQRRQGDIELLNVLGQYQGLPMADGTVVDIAPALRRTVEGYDLDPDLFFRPMDELQQQQQLNEVAQGAASANQMQAQADASLMQAEVQALPQDDGGLEAMGW